MRLGLDTLAASTCTVSLCGSELGAVYTADGPFVTRVPTFGERDQTTPLVVGPLALRVMVWEFVRVAAVGEMFKDVVAPEPAIAYSKFGGP
jgi:hypothetical protein